MGPPASLFHVSSRRGPTLLAAAVAVVVVVLLVLVATRQQQDTALAALGWTTEGLPSSESTHGGGSAPETGAPSGVTPGAVGGTAPSGSAPETGGPGAAGGGTPAEGPEAVSTGRSQGADTTAEAGRGATTGRTPAVSAYRALRDWRSCADARPMGKWIRPQSGGTAVWEEGMSSSRAHPYVSPAEADRASLLGSLNGKTVYFYGDSTMRQVVDAFVSYAGQTEIGFEAMRAKARSELCERQSRPTESYHGKCQANEYTCNMGETVTANSTFNTWYDWKHFAFAEYDVRLIEQTFADPARRPDLLVFSMGLHDCYHMRTVADIAADVDRMVALVSKRFGKPAILLNTQAMRLVEEPHQPTPDNLACYSQVNDHLARSAKQYGIPLFDRSNVTASALELRPTLLRENDTIHFSATVVGVLLAYLLQQMQCTLEAPSPASQVV